MILRWRRTSVGRYLNLYLSPEDRDDRYLLQIYPPPAGAQVEDPPGAIEWVSMMQKTLAKFIIEETKNQDVQA